MLRKEIPIQIIAGTFNVYHRNKQVQIREIKAVFPYAVPKPFDLAVVVLTKEFKKSDPFARPIKLPPQGFFPNGEYAILFVFIGIGCTEPLQVILSA